MRKRLFRRIGINRDQSDKDKAQTKAHQQNELFASGIVVHLRLWGRSSGGYVSSKPDIACGIAEARAVVQTNRPNQTLCPECLVVFDAGIEADILEISPDGRVVDKTASYK